MEWYWIALIIFAGWMTAILLILAFLSGATRPVIVAFPPKVENGRIRYRVR